LILIDVKALRVQVEWRAFNAITKTRIGKIKNARNQRHHAATSRPSAAHSGYSGVSLTTLRKKIGLKKLMGN